MRFVRPFSSAFEGYRGRPLRTVGRSIAAGIAAWGFNLFSMDSFSLALHNHASWSVFALILPVALLATFIPISANGIGVREGLIVLLLVRAHIALGTATALSLFVDLQLLPVRRARRHGLPGAASPPHAQIVQLEADEHNRAGA